MATTSWRELIDERLKGDVLIANTLSDEELDRKFDDHYGDEEGVPFTAWSAAWVYFPVCYDGSEWVGRVPRYPCDTKTPHHGGG